jgi:uncharacterized protein (TIGR02266 family)
MDTGESSAVPVVTLTDRQVVLEYPSFREFISRSATTLGEEGMFVETQSPKAAGSRLSFVLRIADGFQLMQGEAEVVAVREAAAGQSPVGMSIRFQDLDEPGQRLLAKVVDSHRRQGESLFVLEEPSPPAAGEVPAAAPVAAGSLEEEIPELAEIEASVRQEAPPAVPEAVSPSEQSFVVVDEVAPPPPPSDQSFVNVDEATPSTLVTPPDDLAPPPSDQSFLNVDEVSPSTLVTPPDDLAPAPDLGLLSAEPGISVQDLPPVEAQPPLPEPPPLELPEIGDLDAAPLDSDDVQWEEPVAISPPVAAGFRPPQTAPPVPEIRFTDDLADVPVPDELVVASGALKWPEESGAVGKTDLGLPVPALPQGGYSKKRRSGRGMFLLLVVAILAGAAGYAYYKGLLKPYVDVVTSTVASFIEGDSELETPTPVDLPPPIEEPATDGAEAEAESTSPVTAVTEQQPVAPPPSPAVESQPSVPVVSKLSRIDRISWEELGGETLLMLWADDQVVGGQVEFARIDSGGARVIIKIYGVTRAPEESSLNVGTSHIQRIRTGLHQEPRGSVLHVVADLAGADVYVRDMEPQGSRLQVYFAKR